MVVASGRSPGPCERCPSRMVRRPSEDRSCPPSPHFPSQSGAFFPLPPKGRKGREHSPGGIYMLSPAFVLVLVFPIYLPVSDRFPPIRARYGKISIRYLSQQRFEGLLGQEGCEGHQLLPGQALRLKPVHELFQGAFPQERSEAHQLLHLRRLLLGQAFG